MTSTVWVNGVPDGQLDPADRGLAYGDGLFETLRIVQGRAVLEARHWERLAAGCQRLHIPLDIAAVKADFACFLIGRSDGIAKIIVSRGSGGRGYLPPAAAKPTVIASWHESPAYPAVHAESGIVAAICRQPLGLSPLLAGLKHLNRLEQVLLRAELEVLGAPEALVCDLNGCVVEGVVSNVFLVRGNALLTPKLDQAGVAGVMRAEILAQAAGLGISVTEAALMPDDFLQADEVFFCNSVYGIWPVRELAGTRWVPGAVTQRLQQAIAPLFLP